MAVALVGTIATAAHPTVTTAAINTTGANFLAIWATDGGGGIGTPTDSKGNTWIGLTARTGAGFGTGRWYYCFTPIVGTGHTFSLIGSYQTITVFAFSGVASYHSESGSSDGTTKPLVSGSVTPSSNGALILAGFTATGVDTPTAPAGFTTTRIPFVGGTSMESVAGYLIQATAAAVNPSWTWAGAVFDNTATATAVFLASPTTGQISQVAVEAAIQSDAPLLARLSQIALEVVLAPVINYAHIDQLAVEVAVQSDEPLLAQISQIAIEVMIQEITFTEKTQFFIITS